MNKVISTSTILKQPLTVVLLAICLINVQAQRLTPPIGTFRLGISKGTNGRWLALQEKVKGIAFRWETLPDTRGFILEVAITSLQQADTLSWSSGDCQPDMDINVFSVERQAFTCYYSGSMKLHALQAVTPTDDIRLSNGRRDGTPLLLYESGKRTDRPVLAGRCPLAANNKLYFCFYEQNTQADYNYFMLPNLFVKIDESEHSKE